MHSRIKSIGLNLGFDIPLSQSSLNQLSRSNRVHSARPPESLDHPPVSPKSPAISVVFPMTATTTTATTITTTSRIKEGSEGSNTQKSNVSKRSKYSQASVLQRSILSRVCQESSEEKLSRKLFNQSEQIQSLRKAKEKCNAKIQYLKRQITKEQSKMVEKSKVVAGILKTAFRNA